jgi:hypothetical protein
MSDEVIVLYRPVGQAELDLIRAAAYRAFPPRLPHQPIFYPVTTYAYAERIARDWNAHDAASGFAGYVTRFRLSASFLSRYPIQTVGGKALQEYWIPAEDLDEMNRNLIGPVEVIAEVRRDQFQP